MHFKKFTLPIFVVIMLCSQLFISCTASKTEDGQIMKEEELAKLDPMLQRVFKKEGDVPGIIGYKTDDEGIQWFSVVIRTTPTQVGFDEIKELGIKTGAQIGNMITAEVTLEQIRHLLPLESVEYIEAGMTMELQRREK